ncbi:hypothetical protein Egran_06573 [Elaphomyces granulatus]|uniref:Vacuolar calcium ion transporter n=1 Tax=Elaphomyces granulatus TaxID=519963 RepID=A0A232LNE2_9EURO|nr:hypothetical protein Egran_06573 [Elaphomyces granulatus]
MSKPRKRLIVSSDNETGGLDNAHEQPFLIVNPDNNKASAPSHSPPASTTMMNGILTAWMQSPLDVYRVARTKASQENSIYVLLILMPPGIIGGMLGWQSIFVSIFNFLAILPLCSGVSYACDELSFYLGELLGGLLSATFGNCVELLSGILALSHGEVRFAQGVQLGSILSDSLLMLGGCLISAGHKEHVLQFNKAVTAALSSLMVITAVALILPTVLYSTFMSMDSSEIGDKIVSFSRGTAVVLLILYSGYLYFQLKSHPHLFIGSQKDGEATDEATDTNNTAKDEKPSLSLFAASFLLLSCGVGVMICTHYLLGSIDHTAKITGMSKTFIAAILFPIISNSTEGAAVVAASRSGDTDFAISVIVSSILQIALFVIPFLVVLGWFIQQPMTLYFETFQIIILFFSIIVVNNLLQDGKYTYIHGVMLVGL